MGKRQLMNLLLLGAISLPTEAYWFLVLFSLHPWVSCVLFLLHLKDYYRRKWRKAKRYWFNRSGGAGGGQVAKDALGNDVMASKQWTWWQNPYSRLEGTRFSFHIIVCAPYMSCWFPRDVWCEKTGRSDLPGCRKWQNTGNLCGINAVCTYLGCVVPWNAAENKFICPCHGSQYNNQGRVVRGPAP